MTHKNPIKKGHDKKVSSLDKNKHGKINQLKNQLEEKTRESDEHKDLCQRLKAEFDNYKKRVSNEYDEKMKLANENLIRKLITVIDTFERALSVEKSKDDKFVSLYGGMELINKQFLDILNEFDLIEIMPKKNEVFDPTFHEAVLVEEISKGKDDIVLEVLEKGYALSSRLLRAAKVKVGRVSK